MWRRLGGTARSWSRAASVYGAAQVVGGLALGVISDWYLGSRGLLILSFAGAAVAYAIVGSASAAACSAGSIGQDTDQCVAQRAPRGYR